MDARTATSFFLAVLFGAMLFKSRRFVEYFPPFALIFAAMAWRPLIQRWVRLSTELPLHQAISRLQCTAITSTWRTWAAGAAMLVILLPTLWLNLGASRASIQRSKPYQTYAEASTWLQANTPTGARVFQTDWDDFPRLFFYNTHNTYTLGLDPTYMQLYDPRLYDLWVDITKGRVKHPSATISQSFGASYVLTDLDHKDFLRKASDDPGLREVHRDEYAVVFQVIQANSGTQDGGNATLFIGQAD
jgi:hypothetical protein